METVINLTQHVATLEQIEAGVVEPSEEVGAGVGKREIQELLTFEGIPTEEEIVRRSKILAITAWASQGYENPRPSKAMIGGYGALMAPLERALLSVGITPVHAFSQRESTEVDDGNGGIRKVTTFRHLGFVPAVSSDPFQEERDAELRENLLPHFPESFVDDVVAAKKGEG